MGIIFTKQEIEIRFTKCGLKLLQPELYKTKTQLVEIECAKCGHVFSEKLINLENKRDNKCCPNCYGPSRYNNENIDKLLENTTIRRIGDFKTVKHKIRFKCLIDNYEWDALWLPIRTGKYGCPKCGGNARYTNETFDEKISGRNLIRIGEYKCASKKIKMKCLIDGYEWSPYAGHIIKGVGCPKCDGQAKLTHDEVVNKLKSVDIELLEQYKGVNHKHKLKCLKCDKEWIIDLNHVLHSGTGCPKCYKKSEFKVGKLIEEIFNLVPIHNKRLYFDNKKFFIYDYKFNHNNKEYIVEYNGRQHYEPIEYWGGEKSFKKQQKRDQQLREYCDINNIILIEIPYWLSESEQMELLNKHIQ